MRKKVIIIEGNIGIFMAMARVLTGSFCVANILLLSSGNSYHLLL